MCLKMSVNKLSSNEYNKAGLVIAMMAKIGKTINENLPITIGKLFSTEFVYPLVFFMLIIKQTLKISTL